VIEYRLEDALAEFWEHKGNYVQLRRVSNIKHRYIPWKRLTEIEKTPKLTTLQTEVDSLKEKTLSSWKVDNPIKESN